MMTHCCYYEAPFGDLLLAGTDGKLEQVLFPVHHQGVSPEPKWIRDHKPFSDVIDQLDAYFAGTLKTFDLELQLIGTDFQKRVWLELSRISYGTTINYGQLAERVGNPKASRAVGMANGKNPIPIIIPCHRVIGKNGSLTGFGGGLDVKEHLLRLEGVLA